MVTVLDLATDQPAWGVRFEAGVRPMAIEANADGSTKRIFVELSEFHGVAIVDFVTRKEVERIRLPDLRSAENGRGDETTPCHGIAIAPDGKSLWINSTVDNAVFAYSLPRPAAPWPCLAAGAREIGATADQRHTELDYVHAETVTASSSPTRRSIQCP